MKTLDINYKHWIMGVMVLSLLLTSQVTQAQSNLFLMISQPGDYIGQGNTYVTTNPAEFSVSGNATTFGASAFGYGLTFDGPGSDELAVGEYPGATRWPFNGAAPGLDTSGNGRGCNNECGYFRIFELHVTNGTIDRLWVTFSNRCECFNAPLTGEVRFNSQLAPAVPVPQTLLVPAEYPTIQAALNAASLLAVATVLVSPGIYNEAVNFNGKRAILTSVGGPSQTVITSTSGTGVNFSHGETAVAMVSGFTITNCSTGIHASSSSPTIISNVIVRCGTGIYCNFASPTITSNSVLNCSGNGLYLGGAANQLIEGNLIRSNGTGIAMFAAGSPVIRNN